MAITKQLEIQQAVEGEKFNKTVQTFQEFKKELILNGINDIFSSMTIKQDKTKYIFASGGENLFAIDGKVNLVSRLQKFYTEKWLQEQSTEEEKVLIRLEGLELQHITAKTQEELSLLQEDINKTNNLSERATNIENLKYKVERLINTFEQEQDLAKESSRRFKSKYNKTDDNLWKIHKTEIGRRLIELNKIKEQIERLANNKGKTYEIERDIDAANNTKEVSTVKEVKMDDVNAMDMKMTLKQLNDRIEEIGTEVPDFITSRNDIILEKGDTKQYYEIIVNDKNDAKKLIKSLKKVNNQYIILDKLELKWAKRQELSQDLQDLEAYLNKVIDNPDTFKPSENPFVPTHAAEFAELVKIDPAFADFARMNKAKKWETTETAGTAAGTETTEEGTETENTGKEKKWYIESDYESGREAFEKWGIGWVMKHWIDQTNMKPEQKQFWWGVGNLAMTAGVVIVWRKMISSAFKMIFKSGKWAKEAKTGIYDSSNRAWLLGPSALIFGSQARSGEWPMSLFKWGVLTEKLSGIFGGKSEASDEESDTSLKYKSFPWATALFNGLNYGEMKQFLIQDGDRMKIDPDKYDNLLAMFKTGAKKNADAASFLETVGKNDDKNLIDLALTGMGIERTDIQDESKKDNKFNESASEAIVRLRSVTTYMEDKGYNKVNPETMKLVDNYVAKGDDAEYDLEELDKRGDVFYKDTEIVDKTGLESQITTLAGDNIQRKQDLLLAINTFYDQMPNASRKIEISWTRPTITFKTYDQSSTINLENKELVGFTPSRFDSYAETFKAANLTNRIKFLCKDKTAKKENPFYLSTAGKDITFDDASLFSTSFDTEIMTAGWGGSLKNVSPKLEKFKSEYCDYLNTLKFRKTTTA